MAPNAKTDDYLPNDDTLRTIEVLLNQEEESPTRSTRTSNKGHNNAFDLRL